MKDFFFFLEKKLLAILYFLLLPGSVCCLPWFFLILASLFLWFHLYQSSFWVDMGSSQYCGIGELLRVGVRTRFGGSHSYISSLVPVKLLTDLREWPHYFNFVYRVNKICSFSKAQEVGMGWIPNIAIASFPFFLSRLSHITCFLFFLNLIGVLLNEVTWPSSVSVRHWVQNVSCLAYWVPFYPPDIWAKLSDSGLCV